MEFLALVLLIAFVCLALPENDQKEGQDER